MDEDFEIDTSNKLETGRQYLESKIKLYSILMGVIAVVSGFSSFFQKWSFGILGENTTYEIRRVLYHTIMRKNIGWFDDK